ncbi:hypothetical protein VCLMA_B0280 [Vibrio cholerae LMA3984-4]|nr:hypothetical protein VCLMA_B0280 [Vibrio cholerae LMA3984-4]
MKWFLAFWLVLTSCFSVSLYANDAVLQQAYQSQQSDLQVQGLGQVVKVLPDDNDGSRHQKFILKLNSGQTLLVAHNIDLAPRIPNLKVGDSVEFYGEYEWNKKGGGRWSSATNSEKQEILINSLARVQGRNIST